MNQRVPIILLAGAGILAACGENSVTSPVSDAEQVEIESHRVIGGLAEGVRVMTRNVFVGADVDAGLAAQSAAEIPVLAAQAFQQLHATDFRQRARLLAREIAWTRPHLIGLQEISTIRTQSPGDAVIGGTAPVVLVAFGLTPPTGYIRLRDGEDIEVDLELTDDLRAYYRQTKALLHSVMTRNHCRPLDAEFVDRAGMPHEDLHFATAHQVGTCRMADSPHTGVCDAGGEVFGYPGLFVTDGAAIPGSLAVNTSLTILANAERVVASILTSLRSIGRAGP